MKKILSSAIAVSLFFAASAQAQSINTEKSKVSFSIKNMGLTVNGVFGGISGNANIIPNNLGSSSIEAQAETRTVNTGIDSRDEHLRKEDYFSATKFPVIVFKSNSLVKTASGYEATGVLTMKGVSKTVKIPFTVSETGGVKTLSGEFKINRLDYAVGEKSWVMADEAAIKVVCVLK